MSSIFNFPEMSFHSTSAAAALGVANLPEWDLRDLYDGFTAPALRSDLDKLSQLADQFEKKYSDKVKKLTAEQFLEALNESEIIGTLMGRIYAYAHLRKACESTNEEVGGHVQEIEEKLLELSRKTLFFDLELNELDDDAFTKLRNSKVLAGWKHYLDRCRAFKPHQLNKETEQLLLKVGSPARRAWVRLFDETMAGLMVDWGEGEKPLNEALAMMSSPDREERRKSSKSVTAALEKQLPLFSLITNTLAHEKSIMDELRGYKTPQDARNLSNEVTSEMVNALAKSVRESSPKLAHRYYKLKARLMGMDKMKYWDRNAPLFQDVKEPKISWEECSKIVKEAYAQFDPEIGKIAASFLDNPWIDARPRAGKAGGAFAHPVTPDVHPYILTNFEGRMRDVTTVAHEIGHGIHQTLAGKTQGYLRSSTPLTLAETASVFGEMLVFRSLLEKTKDPVLRKKLLAGKIEDMLNTVARQMAFYEFECFVHEQRKKGEIPAKVLGEKWVEIQKESLGDAFDFDADYNVFWAYIPHFIHAPFYVYAYAVGDCLVNGLYSRFKANPDGFADKYRKLLSMGGNGSHEELLKPFDINPGNPAFWQEGLNVLEGLINTFEAEVGEAVHG